MTRCAFCGIQLSGEESLCPHHHQASAWDSWATENRILCDFLHRGRIPPPVPYLPIPLNRT